MLAHYVHAVVPVTGTHERQAVLTGCEAVQDSSHAVFVQRSRFFGPARQIVIRVFVRVYRAAFEEMDGFIQHPGVPGAQNVTGRGQRQPKIIIRTMSADASARGRMPPVLDIAFAELTGRAQQQVLAHQARLGVDEGHHVLQLIAETERAPRLVVSASRPQTARQSLIQEPAIGQDIDGLVGCFHMHGAERVLPVLPHGFERAACDAPDSRKRRTRLLASSASRPTPSLKTISRSCPAASSNGTWIAAQGSKAAPTLPESRERFIAAGVRSVPLRPRNSVRSPLTVRTASSTSKKAIRPRELRVVWIPREQRAARGIDFGDHMHGRFRPQIAQHPFHIARRGEPARSARLVSHLEDRELDRCVQGHVNPQLRADAALRMLEDAVAESVAADVQVRSAPGQRRGGPEVAALFVTQVEGFSARIAHGVIGPGSEAELVGILAPGVGKAAL